MRRSERSEQTSAAWLTLKLNDGSELSFEGCEFSLSDDFIVVRDATRVVIIPVSRIALIERLNYQDAY